MIYDYRVGNKVGFGFHWALFLPSPLPLASSHWAGLSLLRHIICIHPLGVTPDPKLHLHRDLWFIAVGESPHTGLWIACEPLLGLYSNPHPRYYKKIAYNRYKLL